MSSKEEKEIKAIAKVTAQYGPLAIAHALIAVAKAIETLAGVIREK